MNDASPDLLDTLQHDRPAHDPALTARVVDRWLRERAAARRRRIVLATLGPLAAAAVVVLGLTLWFTGAVPAGNEREQQLAAGRAMSALIRDTRVTSAFTQENVHRAIDTTTNLFSGESAVSLLFRDTGDFTSDPMP